ncbi:DUF6338 family protein [Micromonospora chokoriensis]|uniref:DUF6338 family protein n=1 Tax=Micromonospora chokoriensis TaxID=356851 RepID=UPI0004C30444|nr:DUF6338 family protein [Micromonospora chokoriensis]
MPTTIVGLFLTIVFALPGYVYHKLMLRRRPERVDTAVQELLSIVFASVAIDLVAFATLGLVTVVDSLRTPNLSMILLDPAQYSAAHLALVTWWLLAFLGLAIAIAILFGLEPWEKRLPARWLSQRRDRARRVREQQSAWWLLFHEHPESTIHVGCALDDGTYVAGRLHSYSKAPVESGDRELTLSGEILYRAAEDPDAVVLPSVNAVSVSARRIVLLTVTYVVPDPAVPPTTGPPAGASS